MSDLKSDAQGALRDLSAPAEGELEALFQFDPGLEVFGGHFPGHPLVPAVLELEMARVALEKRLSQGAFRILSISRAKFTREIKPGEPVRFQAAFAPGPEPGQWVLKGVLKVEGGKAGQLEMTVKKDG